MKIHRAYDQPYLLLQKQGYVVFHCEHQMYVQQNQELLYMLETKS